MGLYSYGGAVSETSDDQPPGDMSATISTAHDTQENFATSKLSSAPVSSLRPPITTHVLDVALGRPGAGVDVALHWWSETSTHAGIDTIDYGCWSLVGRSVTNNDGRSGPLMPASNQLQPGKYRLTFNTGDYLTRVHGGDKKHEAIFYPYVMVVFLVKPSQASEHFHIPLLLAPYSYSTYRGS